MNMLGLDIGGANLKAAHTDGICKAIPFEFWKRRNEFPQVLQSLIDSLPASAGIGVTMTAEIADCFTTKAEGVRDITKTLVDVAKITPLQFWTTSGEFVGPDIAVEYPKLVAAANWHALATWVGRLVPEGNALLIDIGSTTTDLIPLRNGQPDTAGLTDVERLVSRELVYTGVWRTPLFGLDERVPFGDAFCPIVPELFATTLDLYLIGGQIPEQENCYETADGRSATKSAAYDRIARMLCCDRAELSDTDLNRIADYLHDRQLTRIANALEQVLQRSVHNCSHIIISGSGTFLALELIERLPHIASAERMELRDIFEPATAEAACAVAVANLAAEHFQQPS